MNNQLRGARREARVVGQDTNQRTAALTSPQAASAALPSVLAPRASRLAPRRGISLLEVLISMFVLLFGLMGVAAIFPVGNHYAAKGDRMDRGAALANVAFTELKARGMLDPNNWVYANGQPVISRVGNVGGFTLGQGTGVGVGHAFVIDPVGAAQTVNSFFPLNANLGQSPWDPRILRNGGAVTEIGWPIRRCTMLRQIGLAINNNPVVANKLSQSAAESIFLLRDDATNATPRDGDSPGVQVWRVNDNGTPTNHNDDFPMSRAFGGAYSWMAMILPVSDDSPGAASGQTGQKPPSTVNALLGMQPGNRYYGSFLYEASVIVFNKRASLPTGDLGSSQLATGSPERVLQAQMNPGGELVLYTDRVQDGGVAQTPADEVDLALEGFGAGQWVAVAGVNPNNGCFLVKWYRLLSLDDETTENQLQTGRDRDQYLPTNAAYRRAMVIGPEWPQPATPPQTPPVLRVLIVPGIVSVTTQTLGLDAASPPTSFVGGQTPPY